MATRSLVGVCILAGGLSTRMRRDKARLRLGRRTLLGHVRRAAESLALDVRIIREDVVPRCGPLGGIYTALKTSTHDAELFLSCDMPFVSGSLLSKIIDTRPPIFVEHNGQVGFPFVLSVTDLETVEQQIRGGRLSLQNFARRVGARHLRLRGPAARQLLNVNTLADWQEALGRRAELPL